MLRIEFELDEKLLLIESESAGFAISIYKGANLLSKQYFVPQQSQSEDIGIFVSAKNNVGVVLEGHCVILQGPKNKLIRCKDVPSEMTLFFRKEEFVNARKRYWKEMLARENVQKQ